MTTNAVDTSKTRSNNNVQTAAAADPSTPAVTPEQLVEQIRAMSAAVGDFASLTAAERARLRKASDVPIEAVRAQIGIIGGDVETSLGRSADDVRQLMDQDTRWAAVEYELKALLDGVQGANLIRRRTIVLVASQAGVIGGALARDPKNGQLAAQMKEIRRIKRAARKKSPQQTTPPADQHPNGT